MSSSGRKLRRRRKVQDAYTCNLIDSQDYEKTSGGSTFQSDTLSSDGGAPNNSKPKPKRRIIRRTQDFQSLNASTLVVENDNDKITAKKVKKSKKAAFLPQISNIAEEYDILRNKIRKRQKRKQNTTSVSAHSSPESVPQHHSIAKSDTDTSVPSDNRLGADDKENEAVVKHKNTKKRNRKRKKVKSSYVTYSNENASHTDTCESDIATKSSDLSDLEQRDSNTVEKPTSALDVYSFGNRERLALSGDEVQSATDSLKIPDDSEDDSVSYNFKTKPGKKIVQKSLEGKKENDSTTQSNLKQKNKKKQSCSEVTSTVNLAQQDTEVQNRQRRSKCSLEMTCDMTNPKITIFSERCENECIIPSSDIEVAKLEGKRACKSIIKGSTANINSAKNQDSVPSMLNRKSVQFQTNQLLNSPDEDVSENRRDTYELDRSINSISVLKSFIVENDGSTFEDPGEHKVVSKEEESDLQNSSRAKLSNNSNRIFEQKESVTNFILSKSSSGENTFQNIDAVGTTDRLLDKIKKSRSRSNTPYSRVTRRRKVKGEANVKFIDHISPPESVTSLPSATANSLGKKHRSNLSSIASENIQVLFPNLRNTDCDDPSIQSPLLKQISRFSKSDQNISLLKVNSSTPLPKREGTYILSKGQSSKKILLSSQKGNLVSQPSASKPVTRTKMPNFSQIHKKAFEKMEDIEQLQQRKAERAKLLLSGAKPSIASKLQSPRNRNILKSLNFGHEQFKSSDVLESPKPLHNVFSQKGIVDSPKLLPSNLQSPRVKVKPAFTLHQKIGEKSNTLKAIVQETNMKSHTKEMSSFKSSVQEYNSKHNNMPSVRSNGFTRYGFKPTSIPTKTITKQEQIKAIANKNNVIRSNVDKRRCAIKGVRSNRRFELLMKMRNNT